MIKRGRVSGLLTTLLSDLTTLRSDLTAECELCVFTAPTWRFERECTRVDHAWKIGARRSVRQIRKAAEANDYVEGG